MHLAQEQNVHATAESPNGSDERQQSGEMKAVGCLSLGGVCGGLRHQELVTFLKTRFTACVRI